MTKLTGAAKREFLARMAKGKRDAAKKKKSKSKSRKISKAEQARLRKARNRGTDLRRSNIDDSLLLALHDPNVKEIVIKK